MKNNLEKIGLIEKTEKVTQKEMSPSMLLTYARMNGGKADILIGSYRCTLTITSPEFYEQND